MLNNRRTSELAVHYNSSRHDISQMRFVVIEQIVSFQNPLHLDQLLFTREACAAPEMIPNPEMILKSTPK